MIERKDEIIGQFLSETSSENLRLLVCAVCAEERNCAEFAHDLVDLSDFDNSLLEGKYPEGYDVDGLVFDGDKTMMVEPRGILNTDCGVKLRMCNSCHRSLIRLSQTPRFAIANGLCH